MKQKFNFSNIGEDIWIRVEQIRENNLEASEIGNINVNQYNWTEYDFPMKTTYKTNFEMKDKNEKCFLSKCICSKNVVLFLK